MTTYASENCSPLARGETPSKCVECADAVGRRYPLSRVTAHYQVRSRVQCLLETADRRAVRASTDEQRTGYARGVAIVHPRHKMPRCVSVVSERAGSANPRELTLKQKKGRGAQSNVYIYLKYILNNRAGRVREEEARSPARSTRSHERNARGHHWRSRELVQRRWHHAGHRGLVVRCARRIVASILTACTSTERG